MSDEPTDRILDAAYSCFVRHGVRRTTMDDIASAAGMSRPAVYQYFKNKDDVFRQLGTKVFAKALAGATHAAGQDGLLVDRVHGALAAKLELALQLVHESPHAAELLDTSARLSGELVETFRNEVGQLLTDLITAAEASGEVDLGSAQAGEISDIALALNHGLEADLTDPEWPRRRLRLGIELLIGGLAPKRALNSEEPGLELA